MITLDQIKKLDSKVREALNRISSLKEENSELKKRLSEYERRIEELDVFVARFKKEQGEIEAGIINVLSKLDSLEDDVETAGSDLAFLQAETAQKPEAYEELAAEKYPEAQDQKKDSDQLDIF